MGSDLRGRTFAGLLLLLSGSVFLIGVMLAETMAPGYSMNADAISDLGTIDGSSECSTSPSS